MLTSYKQHFHEPNPKLQKWIDEVPDEIRIRLVEDGCRTNITLTDVLEEIEYYIEMYENGWLIDNEEAGENPEARKYYRDQVKKMKKFYNKYKKYKGVGN